MFDGSLDDIPDEYRLTGGGEELENNGKIVVVVVEPGKEPRIEEIDSGLESLQGMVGGYMRYPQFFASKALVKRLDNGGKSGIIWHTQGSGKTALAAMSTRILRDYYAEKGITARFYYVVDRLDLLTQVSGEMAKRGLNVINVDSKYGR